MSNTKSSFASLTGDLQKMMNNSLGVYNSLNEIVRSKDSEITVSVTDASNQTTEVMLPTVGYLLSEIQRLTANLNTLASIDQRGSVIQSSANEYKRIIVSDLNREPNPITELNGVTEFMAESNWFFDSLLNPILKVRLDLTGKVENNSRKVLSRRYIINFEKDEFGNPTERGQQAITAFNSQFKNRTDITTEEIENWLLNTQGISASAQGKLVNYDEEVFELEPNKILSRGFFTITGVSEDTVTKRTYYEIDTLDYTNTETGETKQLKTGDVIIPNKDVTTTRYKVIEINTEASEFRIRLERIEGFEPVAVGIAQGMKLYSDYAVNKNVDISVGFNEYNIIFLKAINTDNHLESREWSRGTAYYTNDLTLSSSDGVSQDGRAMNDFYVDVVRDFGSMLKDLVERFIPRQKGVKPNPPVLSETNFRVRQVNKYLTENASIAKQRDKHKQVRELRSKLDETSKVIQEKNKELVGKKFKNPKEKADIENQISKLKETAESDTELLNTTVSELLTLTQSDTVSDPVFNAEGMWPIPSPAESDRTRVQNVIGFRIQWRSSSIEGKEDENETFKILNEDGTETTAVVSPWKNIKTDIRKRTFNTDTQKYEWMDEDLGSVDTPNVNSLSVPIKPYEQVTVRVKSISEVGYPDSPIESDWSNEISIPFPDDLIPSESPQEQFKKNAELEDMRSRVQSDLDRKGLSQHLSDGVTFENKYYSHVMDNIGYTDSQGRVISASAKIKQLEAADPVENEKQLPLRTPWVNYGGAYGNAGYYLHEGRVYLSGVVRVDKGDDEPDFESRFPAEEIILTASPSVNNQYSVIGYLPENYRSNKKTIHSTTSYGADGIPTTSRIEVADDGAVIVYYGNTGWISLDGISFRI